MGMAEVNGWLLDLYEDPDRGLKLWFILEDERRVCLYQPFPVCFYAAGAAHRLRALWRWLSSLPDFPALAREERRDLFTPDPIPVLAVRVEKPSALRELFQRTEQAFPDLTYYDADVQVQLRHAARYGTFPLAFCQLTTDSSESIRQIEVQTSRWEIDPAPPPLRVMEIDLDSDPAKTAPTAMTVRFRAECRRLPILPGETTAYWVKTLLKQHDPDILVTDFGDTWLLDHLAESVHHDHEKLPLNRDAACPVTHIREKSYFSYGQIVYRGRQVHLHGRVHIDRQNAMIWSDYGLEGILETARVTALPIQTAARVSPGTGISGMQMITALQNGILIPWHKQQVEQPKTMLDLIHADFGGLVYQPTVGLHRDVAEIDFVSLYPSVMVRCNISPEKSPLSLSDPPPAQPGLIPQTLAPLLLKRVELKTRTPGFPGWDPRRKEYKARSSALKWLLVVCFGYLGYKNARFGRIESHEAVTAGGREALLRAKEAAEDLDFRVLHLFVDCLWVQKAGCIQGEDFQALIEEVNARTGLHIALNGIYRWVVFLPSRLDERVPVGNRYFGVYQDGTIKVRGLDARRRDTPPWVAQTQMALIEHLAQAPDADQLPGCLPGMLDLLRRELRRLRAGQVPLEDLLMAQRLSRSPEKYATPSPAARAALQLQAAGKGVQPGQRVRFWYVLGKQSVWAWELPNFLPPCRIDVAKYRQLLLRAAESVFQPFGISAQEMDLLMDGNTASIPLPFMEFQKPWLVPGPSVIHF